MDEAADTVLSLLCPGCSGGIGTPFGESSSSGSGSDLPAAHIFVEYTNEGGTQDKLDIFPSVREEAYTQQHPEVIPARALHVMCAEGDVDGMVELLMHVGDQVPDIGGMIRYRDPLSGLQSGLHLAVENMHEGVIWLLLWLSSTLDYDSFPLGARQAAESMSLGRLNIDSGEDIRLLRNAQGLTAEAFARTLDRPLLRLVESGLLTV